jgi:hypothetical protein
MTSASSRSASSRASLHQLVELGAHHAERGLGHGIVEPQHDPARFDLAPS